MNLANPDKSPFSLRGPIRVLRALVAAGALGALTPLQAQPPAGSTPGAPAAQADPMQAARQLHGEYVELQKRLGMIQEKTVKAHPELQQQGKALEALMMSKMKLAGGASPKDEMAALDALEQKLRSDKTPESERETLMKDYHQRAQAFREAQIKALQDPEVKKAQGELMEKTIAAMKAQDPKTEELLQQLQEKQAQMRQMMESAGHGK